MTVGEFGELRQGDIVRVTYNGVVADYVVTKQDSDGVEFMPLSCGFTVRYEKLDKWNISAFNLLKKGKNQ